MERKPNTQYVLSISYGKDSLACLGAIEKLGLPLDRIVHAEVWATQDIPADLPPMVEFKKKADKIILDRWGIQVEHFCAVKRERERERHLMMRWAGGSSERLSYKDIFYRVRKNNLQICGFPTHNVNWCTGELKNAAIKAVSKSFPHCPRTQGAR